MQDMPFNDKHTLLFLRRRHKLFRSLARGGCGGEGGGQMDVAALYEMIINKENEITQIDYFIKHELSSDLGRYAPAIMGMLWQLLDLRSGSLLAFVAYRLSRKFPSSYWLVLDFLKDKITSRSVIFITDLYLCGFSLTSQQFVHELFPAFRPHALELVPKYVRLLASHEFFSPRNQKIFLEGMGLWMGECRKRLEGQHGLMQERSKLVQQGLVKELENEQEEARYIHQFQLYETELYRFANAMAHLGSQFDIEQFRVKSIFQLKKQCRTFKLSFQYSEYDRLLYFLSHPPLEIKPFKKSEMLKLEQSEAYVTRVKLCSTIKECVQLAGYFLQQMNLQHNREELIEIIINDCYHYNNISYILKIVMEICHREPSLVEYCCGKGRKICGQSRMNQKYQKLLCEMSRFRLMDENILLDYCDKILKLENNQVTKEVESILQHLGTMVYYRSLPTHTRINSIFERMEAMMKSKLVHFNIEHLFHLKGLLNYLRNHTNQISTANTEEFAELEIKANFQFIFKKMDKLLRENEVRKVLDFVEAGINQQDFLNSYYYASLVKDLNHKELNILLHELTITTIDGSLAQLNAQRSVCWSRFLGELYNYEIINRKKLIENLWEIMRKHDSPGTLSSCLKCICSTLETTKYYLKESEVSRERKEVIFLLIELQRRLLSITNLEKLLADQVSQIIEYFHPYLTSLNTLQKIEDLLYLSGDAQGRYNPYALLDDLQNGADLEQMKSVQRSEVKRKYQQKEKLQDKIQSQKKWTQKPVKFKEKPPETTFQKSESQRSRPSPSKQSTLAEEPREPILQKKQIKVMGRSRADKKIKVVTYDYTAPAPSNDP